LKEALQSTAEGIDVNTRNRLVRIDRHLSEYFLFQTYAGRTSHECPR
jgi:hypothetical protein